MGFCADIPSPRRSGSIGTEASGSISAPPVVQEVSQVPANYPVVIERHGPGPQGPGGYVVALGNAKSKGYAWTPSLMDSFDVDGLRQFVPVFQVF